MIGTRINNYEVVQPIGEGGMGTVYLARHPFIGRKAAVKVLHEQLARDKALVARFVNEARAANAIRHPNIIDIIDVGMVPGTETPYLMMEFLEGENLAERLRKVGRLGVAEAVDVAQQTAAALAAAHGAGIIHRDLKPENLFLVPTVTLPGRTQVKVLDFGIAKLRGELSGNTPRTETGALMGTPPYMSPEQCRGIARDVDHRTDLYALGIILYEMLCGAPPFQGAGYGDILVMHLMQPPEPPRQKNPDIPEALEALILRALAKQPDNRFPTMTDLGSALSATSRTMPVVTSQILSAAAAGASARPRETTTFTQTSGQVSDHLPAAGARPKRRGLALVGAAVAMAAVAGVALVLVQGARPTGAEPQPDPPGVTAAEPAPAALVPAAAPAPVPEPVATAAPAAAPDAGAPATTQTPARKRGRPKSTPAASGPEKW
jgi:eukaryotic-like serine/threonine-protein kinase